MIPLRARSSGSLFILHSDNGGMAGSARGISEIMIRFALISLSLLIILLGIIIFSMPLPFGAATILIGCALLVSVSETAAARLTGLRIRYPRLNRFFASVEVRAPGALGRALRRTTPKTINGTCRQS